MGTPLRIGRIDATHINVGCLLALIFAPFLAPTLHLVLALLLVPLLVSLRLVQRRQCALGPTVRRALMYSRCALRWQWQDRCALAAPRQPNQRDFVFLLKRRAVFLRERCVASHAGPHADLQNRLVLVLVLVLVFSFLVIVLHVLEEIGLDAS
eukprot:scaffold18951_cov63-Phaeocystis_antarctica.AAC.3